MRQRAIVELVDQRITELDGQRTGQALGMPVNLVEHILFEDNHCLVLAKRAGHLVTGDQTGDRSLLDEAREYLRITYNKPGNVYVGLVHRIDRPVSGIVLFARTSKAASRLSQQFRDHTIGKKYLAVVSGRMAQDTSQMIDWLKKDRSRNRTSVVDPEELGAQRAELIWRSLGRVGDHTLLELEPRTGRPHQIRVQLASRGLPIVGDLKYGGRQWRREAIALHAAGLKFEHPTKRISISVECPVPKTWSEFGFEF